jgi:hypothetical protein
MVSGASAQVKLYNSLVLGNTGYSGLDDDLTITAGTSYTANNSLAGGISDTDMNATSGGSGNANGTNLGAAAPSLAKLDNGFFKKFAALPTEGGTGAGYIAANWDFQLTQNVPTSVINGGSAAHYSLVSGGVTTDLAGASRIENGAPDMGAYESLYQGTGGSIGP